jgi:hypothetical protein
MFLQDGCGIVTPHMEDFAKAVRARLHFLEALQLTQIL